MHARGARLRQETARHMHQHHGLLVRERNLQHPHGPGDPRLRPRGRVVLVPQHAAADGPDDGVRAGNLRVRDQYPADDDAGSREQGAGYHVRDAEEHDVDDDRGKYGGRVRLPSYDQDADPETVPQDSAREVEQSHCGERAQWFRSEQDLSGAAESHLQHPGLGLGDGGQQS